MLRLYRRLYKYYGPQEWWPARTRFEVIVGAILTQNTAWINVEKAMRNLKNTRLLSPRRIKDIRLKKLAAIIKPAGYYNVKAGRLKNFINFLYLKYGGSLNAMSGESTERLRAELLGVNGIGPETCDSILLYAFRRPVFVIDAYTKRIFSRHHFFEKNIKYDEAQKFFMDRLPKKSGLYNEYHALIVKLAKECCKSKKDCGECFLGDVKIS